MPPLLLALLLLGAASRAGAQPAAPPGAFTDAQCTGCHADTDPGLIEQWRNGPHGARACSDCHGERHAGAAPRARADRTCTGCHEGPAGHSYATSKHGVINRLEAPRHGWEAPLRRGRYRSPGCAYCHLHGADHGDAMDPARDPLARRWICSGCHSPRYSEEQLAAGARQLEIADLKLAEGEALIGRAGDAGAAALAGLRERLHRHRRNVALGVGHQSPDYQWWHGQPALDGDLIRIRDALAGPAPPEVGSATGDRSRD